MDALLTALLQDKSIEELNECYGRRKGQAMIYGLSGSQKRAAVAACYRQQPRPMVIASYDVSQLGEWQEDLGALLPEARIVVMPVEDITDFNVAAKSLQQLSKRMDILGQLMNNEPVIVLTQIGTAAHKGISPQQFASMRLNIKIGQELELKSLIEVLVNMGYERTDQVENTGQFSVRGGIVDIFPINKPKPYRIEFFDIEVDSIREFELSTQLSQQVLMSAEILPVAVKQNKNNDSSFIEYLPVGSDIIFDEPLRLRENLTKLGKENPELKDRFLNWETLAERAKGYNIIYMTLVMQRLHAAEPDRLISVKVNGVTSYQRQFEMVISDMQDWIARKSQILVLMGDKVKSDSLKELLARNRVASIQADNPVELRSGIVTIAQGVLLNGFELPEAGLVVVTEKDIFGRQKKRRAKVSKEAQINHFRDIKVGDYVVHINHGIGKYLGVKTMEVNGIHRDFLHLKYGGDDNLFVPTDQVSMLQKYIGSEGDVPKLHRMGGTEWIKAKARAKASVEDIAKDLIKLYAARQKNTGFAFDKDTVWQQEFEDAFPYEETPDQLAAIAEIKRDMEKPAPMDRLLCGDVGFGKTEVAIRAAFKAVMSGKQVAVLVPTTVLAQQHFQTFTHRFKNFGPIIDVINRFRSVKEQRETLERVEQGRVDILIGTHALLNQKKVKFHDLGLLVVDEEQRFGVKQKEKIKQLSTGIDVLTLSATPIPRTLHMSLVGARDMSIIESAPAERFPVQTYVVEDNPMILKNAIRREIKRGGQIYFVYNRVETIMKMQARLEELVPEARIQVAHGQMQDDMLERIMVEFYEGQYDILLATSIIENGLDIANANTIIIYNADQLGLAQLYQMRGRVGRSNQLAYAYFVYKENKVLSEAAEKRLEAIKEFAELGAGFKIAMRDLEIRGAGNILGAQQHGHIASVGFEMYCKLLDEAVTALKTGKPVKKQADPLIELKAEAYLDGDYIGDAMHKIELYQRIAAIRRNEEVDSIYDELVDRFGMPVQPVLALLDVARIRNYARDIGIKRIAQTDVFLEVEFLPNPNFATEGILNISKQLGRNVKFLPAQGMMRVRLVPAYKKDIITFVLELVEALHNEEQK